MAERPILFSAPMVRAILEGRKTQTRRALKPQPTKPAYKLVSDGRSAVYESVIGNFKSRPSDTWIKCPYGQPDDTLWVRETWGAVSPTDEPVPLALGQCEIEYRADLPPGCTDGPGEWPADARDDPEAPKWRPSIHMPRWASRITLRITDVRVERLQDISEDDARAEGCQERPFPGPWWQGYRDLGDGEMLHQQAVGETAPDWMIEPKQMPPTPWLDRSARDGFRSIWMGLHAPGAWDANPWVWALTFERVKP